MYWAELFSKFAPGAAALFAAWVARSGLQTWRRQLRGQAQYELARRVLRAVLRVRDLMDGVRSPMITAGEFAAAYEAAGENPPEILSDSRGTQLVYDRRWQTLSAAMTELQSELVEAEVFWGKALRDDEVTLRKCYAELFSAVSMHLRAQASKHVGESLSQVVENQFRTLYKVHSDEDPDLFGNRIESCVTRFENQLRPHLRLETP